MKPSKPQALLFIDGYNVIGAWPELANVRDEHGLESARYQLIEEVVNYSAYKGFETRLVFDAYAHRAPSWEEVITHHLSVHYTEFGQTADTYIEKCCAGLRDRQRWRHQKLIVATSDRAQQLTVAGYGAQWMSAKQLAADILATTRRRQHPKRPAKAGKSQRLLAHTLTPEAHERLQKLRFGLDL